MAVELKCPDCRAKLRLKLAPEVGTEVECPKCGTVFPAPDTDAGEDAPKPKKKKVPTDDEEAAKEDIVKELKKARDSESESKPAASAKAKSKASNVPRKRKAKKRETSKAALIGVIAAAVLMVIVLTGVLIWFFTRTSRAVEMLYYVPEDAQEAIGLNLDHAQKYPEFYKAMKTLQEKKDFKVIGDAIAKAAGTDMDSLIALVIKAESKKHGWTIVYRTKAEFDDSALSKLSGAKQKTLEGVTYYTAPGLLPENQTGLVFAPTPRLIVVCPASLDGTPTFKKMLTGHEGSRESTMGVRMGPLAKRITRGTFWQLTLFDKDVTPPAPPPPKKDGETPQAGQEDEAARQFLQEKSGALSGTNGYGFKASIGSREVRFELAIWHKDSEKASSFSTKMKESALGKGDDGDPPKWFKDQTLTLGDKKIAAQLLSNIGFGASGELFYAKSAVETADLIQSVTTVLSRVLGYQPQIPGAGVPPPDGGPPGPPPPPPPPPGGGTPRRRRVWSRR